MEHEHHPHHESHKGLYLWARIDYWIRQAFEDQDSALYRVVNDIIVVLIIFSILSVMLESVESIYTKYQAFFNISEMVVVGIFTIEYIANIYVADKKLKYIFGPWGLIDFFAIMPSYLNLGDFRALKILRVARVLRFLRLMRMLRLLKLAKQTDQTLEERERVNKFDTLKMDLQIYFITLFSALVVFSTLEYYIERNVPNSLFTSIPQSMWWAIVTMTTTGYGDMYPMTPLGRVVAGIAMLCGVALFGLLMNIIGKSMMSALFGASEMGTPEEQAKEAEKILEKERHHPGE